MNKINRKKAEKLIGCMEQKPIKSGKNKIVFARADLDDVRRIEKMNDDDLIKAYHQYAYLIEFDMPMSLMDLQLESLFCWEIESRGLFGKSKKIWENKYGKK